MEDSTQRAKELYTRFLGSSFNMHREGVLEEYKKFEILRETEIEWLNEVVVELSKQLSIRDWDAISSLETLSKNYQDSLIVDKATSFASRNMMSADSIVRLMFAEKLLEIIRSHKKVISQELLFNACRVVVQILEDVISQPLIIDPGHALEQLLVKDKRSLNHRAKQSIEVVKELIN
ncbi:hypothetical protein H1230_10000 [Paenibacillus sp. 19GGS1-52]|uniref:hypothetical protein n=1 Tax=Paenibacillus sp. 19GGS1-52 TaxID=2758563 RepID=UPI001EFB800B|nr:hypothetical protein [Paenibacillus sp. 19GGS1-52]ULO09065.1 hypothetical protein H1230_10000 [Paenibacillus sp. 19GGS1-52]